jgi:putative Ca2+/H+ antiporter (TMEM165/GDT1 family)|tara:strand:- start:1354 stop:1557 length:204 start_codon:yes stop_codon:yes gene_type:complete
VKKQPKPWLVFSGLVFQIAAIMYLSSLIGEWADLHFESENNYFTLALSVLGITLVIFLIISQTKNLK